VRDLVIGIPAREEGATIGTLVSALDGAASLLGEVATAELVLAYQDSTDDTLANFAAAAGRWPRRVLRSAPGASGKGRNVRLLVEHAIARGADLLLVDGDIRDPVPVDFARFVASGYDDDSDMVLPLWCRPWGHANATNYLAVPVVRALFGAEIRQPLAGLRLLAHRALRHLDPASLPDDYGIDAALTMAVLEAGGRVGQVVVARIEHDGRQLNSETIMVEVARALFERVAAGPTADRADLVRPAGYERRLRWPEESHEPDGAGSPPAARPAPPMDGRDPRRAWLDALKAALEAAADRADPGELAASLVGAFFDHAEWRRRSARPELAEAEAYVWELAAELAARLR
jgi:hypothetical protein